MTETRRYQFVRTLPNELEVGDFFLSYVNTFDQIIKIAGKHFYSYNQSNDRVEKHPKLECWDYLYKKV